MNAAADPAPLDAALDTELNAQHGASQGLARRDFLKVGVGFSVALGVAVSLGGCGNSAKTPAAGHSFLLPDDVALFSALLPAVILDMAKFDATQRKAVAANVLRNIDGTCSALGLASQQELRKLLDLLSVAPLRYVLTGVGQWQEASVSDMQAFLTRWRGSSFGTLNAGGNVLTKLTASSFFILPVSWPLTGYPGPLDHVFKVVNS